MFPASFSDVTILHVALMTPRLTGMPDNKEAIFDNAKYIGTFKQKFGKRLAGIL